MLEEAVALMRDLWRGDLVSHRGKHYTVDRARIYSLPDEPPPIAVAAAAPAAAELAARIGDGFVSTAPDGDLDSKFDAGGGKGKPRYGQLTVCWAESEDEAVQTALEWWPNAALKGDLGQELALPSMFEAAATMVDEDAIADAVVCGPDPELHRKKIAEFEQAGFDHVYVHQVGPDQDGFMRFYEREILGAYAHARCSRGLLSRALRACDVG